MLSTKYLYEISDINKSRLGVAGRAALVGGAGFAAYHALKGNDVDQAPKTPKTPKPSDETPTKPANSNTPIKTRSDRAVGQTKSDVTKNPWNPFKSLKTHSPEKTMVPTHAPEPSNYRPGATGHNPPVKASTMTTKQPPGLNVKDPGSRTSKLGLNTNSDRKRMNDNGL